MTVNKNNKLCTQSSHNRSEVSNSLQLLLLLLLLFSSDNGRVQLKHFCSSSSNSCSSSSSSSNSSSSSSSSSMKEAYLFVQNAYIVLEHKPVPGLHTYIELIQAERVTRKHETWENSSNCSQAHSLS